MRTVLILLGLLLAQPSWAAWVQVKTLNDGATTYYIDPALVRKTIDGRRTWLLISYSNEPPRVLRRLVGLSAHACGTACAVLTCPGI
jgi:hypothetical protein